MSIRVGAACPSFGIWLGTDAPYLIYEGTYRVYIGWKVLPLLLAQDLAPTPQF